MTDRHTKKGRDTGRGAEGLRWSGGGGGGYWHDLPVGSDIQTIDWCCYTVWPTADVPTTGLG